MDPRFENLRNMTRRHFFGSAVGTAALATLLNDDLRGAESGAEATGGLPGLPHFPPKAKRIIYLFQSGGPSQLELFDYKPRLSDLSGSELPESVRQGQRLTSMTSAQASFPVIQSIFKFAQHGKSGAWVSELLPHTAGVVDDLCFIKSMHTDAINHDPGVTFLQTGSQLAGRPSLGSWVAYGLGSENKDIPAFVVLLSAGTGPGDQPLADRMWGSGFLPTKYQGVKFRSSGDPVLYLSNPPGVSGSDRRRFLDDLDKLNSSFAGTSGRSRDFNAHFLEHEMAYRMQASVPELADLSKEPDSVFLKNMARIRGKPGTFAAQCLLARRLVERGVRFVQLYHRGWDQHNLLPKQLPNQCRDTDQACAALIQDLKERGLLEDTLVIWGGEFGRTVYCQGKLVPDNYGRDHHPKCFTMWMAGGGVKPGITYGETDDYSYNVARDPVHVHDLNATILHSLGVDHTRLTFKFQGRHFRLTDVSGSVVKEILV